MKWTEIPTGQTNGAFQRFMVALGEKAEVAVTRINMEPTFVERLAEYAINGCIIPNASHDGARDVMGKNFFGIEEAIKYFGVNPTRRQLAMLSEIPFSPEELMMCKDTHVLVAVLPVSIIEIREIAKKLLNQTLFYNQDWYDEEVFANDKVETGWQLIRKEPIINSTSKNWSEQQALLTNDEETPKAQVVVYTIIGIFLSTGERLFENVYVRCIDLGSDGNRVSVGGFDDRGLDVSDWDDDDRDSLIGVSSARK